MKGKKELILYFLKCPFCLSELVCLFGWVFFQNFFIVLINALEVPSLKYAFVYKVPWPFLMHYKVVTSQCCKILLFWLFPWLCQCFWDVTRLVECWCVVLETAPSKVYLKHMQDEFLEIVMCNVF